MVILHLRANRSLVKALLFELIGGGGIGAPLPLGYNNLFLNQLLPWWALRPTFRVLLVTRKCSFSLEIYWTSKSTT